MPSADKRARQKENARLAREQREAALRRKKRTRSTITIGIVVALFAGVIILINVAGGSDKKGTPTTTTTPAKPDPVLDPSKTYIATVTTNFGPIKLELDAKNAPKGAAHFVALARAGVYDGSRWHRILKGFVVQGGAPGGDPVKEYGHSVVAEVPKGKYKMYDLAAAKGNTDPAGTFDSQFFIVTGKQGVDLPPDYADFGHLVSGKDVVNKLLALKVDSNGDPEGTPSQEATIDKVTISVSGGTTTTAGSASTTTSTTAATTTTTPAPG